MILLGAISIAACTEHARLEASDGVGAHPVLPPPKATLLPTFLVATAVGWPDGRTPTPAPGTEVTAFARGLDHPRWLSVLGNGDVLVAETNAPPRPEDGKGIKGWITRLVMKRTGAAVASADRITLLRDADGDGIAETSSVFLDHLHSPFGMEIVGGEFLVADTDAVWRFPYMTGQTAITARGVKLLDLPAGPINHHWTKNILASRDGRKLYVTVGSNSNVAENGMAAEAERASIWEVDLSSGSHRVFASGLRNPNGLAWATPGGALWTTVNERDEIGSDLVPDYMTSVADGAFYGWPYSYYGAHVDDRVKPPRPDLVAAAVAPDYALGAHTASLGLAFLDAGTRVAEPADGGKDGLRRCFGEGAFVGQHGSWNRKPRSGYKVIFVPFLDGRPSGAPVDVLTGFVSHDGLAYGRPVGVAIDRRGGLLVADDVGNTIWRVVANPVEGSGARTGA